MIQFLNYHQFRFRFKFESFSFKINFSKKINKYFLYQKINVHVYKSNLY